MDHDWVDFHQSFENHLNNTNPVRERKKNQSCRFGVISEKYLADYLKKKKKNNLPMIVLPFLVR